MATKSATSRQGSMVGEGGQWEGRSVLIKVESACVMDAGREGKVCDGRNEIRRGGAYTQVHVYCNKDTNLKMYV